MLQIPEAGGGAVDSDVWAGIVEGERETGDVENGKGAMGGVSKGRGRRLEVYCIYHRLGDGEWLGMLVLPRAMGVMVW